jgi:hypothetical protein
MNGPNNRTGTRALEAEMAGLKAWDAEKQNYELKSIGPGSVAYMMKPDKRGSEAPHWLCPIAARKARKRVSIRPAHRWDADGSINAAAVVRSRYATLAKLD